MSSNDPPPPPPAAAAGNNPNPPARGTGPGGRPPPEGRSASRGNQAPRPNQGNPGPTIWDSINDFDLMQHPLLRTSLMITKENIELCLSRCYAGVDSAEAQDHKRVLLSLPGRIVLGETDDGVHATYRNGVGIIFNRDFVHWSTTVARRALRLRSLADDDNVLNFIAFLQETLEHELGHIKYHLEGVKDDNGGIADPGSDLLTPPRLRFEAGYAAQESIRKTNFPNEGNARILEVLDEEDVQHLELYFEELKAVPSFHLDQFIDSPPPGYYAKISREALLKHMDYPRNCRGKKRGREDEEQSFNPPDDGPSTGKGGDGDGDADGDAGGDAGGDGNADRGSKPSSSQRNTRTWLESVAHFLAIAMAAYETTIKKKQPQVETSSDWKDPLLQIGYKNQMNKQTFAQCDLQVMTCDENRKEKTQFSTQENIYVKVFVRNNSKESVFIQIAPGSTFGRIGLNVQIKGVEEGRVEKHRAKGLEIKPSESYTLFRIFTKPEKDYSVEYETPSPGQYKAIVPWFSNFHGQIPSCSFSTVRRARRLFEEVEKE